LVASPAILWCALPVDPLRCSLIDDSLAATY
jgi:hypothetical protein